MIYSIFMKVLIDKDYKKMFLNKTNDILLYYKTMEYKLQLLIDYFDNLNVENGLQFSNNSDEILYDIFKKYNNNKTIRYTKPVYWPAVIEGEYDENITGIYIDDVDRGVMDWDVFDKTLRKNYPNLSSIYVNQCFGEYNLTDSNCELIILLSVNTNDYEIKYTTSNSKIKRIEHIYKKLLYDTNCGEFKYDEDGVSIDIIKVNEQIQVLINI
jgi:hypothetical protein